MDEERVEVSWGGAQSSELTDLGGIPPAIQPIVLRELDYRRALALGLPARRSAEDERLNASMKLRVQVTNPAEPGSPLPKPPSQLLFQALVFGGVLLLLRLVLRFL
jgi:hypothetical protein